MKKLFAKIAVVLILTGALTGITSVAGAQAAHAGTISQCIPVDAGYRYTIDGYNRYGVLCYIDYDWVEEVFFGYRDGYKWVWKGNYRCDSNIHMWLGYWPWGCGW